MDLWHDVALEWHAQLNELMYQGLVEKPPKKGRSFMKLMPHQQKAVDDLHNGAILVGEVGVGKTITALTYFYTKVCGGVDPSTGTMRTPMDVYVITTAKKRDSLDWQGDAASLGISDDREKSIEAIKITVDSWNNIGKYTEVKDAFFIFDEQRLVGSGHWSKSFIKIAKHNKWILLSATPGDTWLDYIPVFVANGFYKNRTDFKRQHCVYNTYTKFPKVERYVGIGKLVRNKKAVLVEMPYLRHTVRHNETIKVAHDKQLFEQAVKDRWHVFENRPIRDVAELFHVMRKVVNYDVSRVEEIEKLLVKHPKLIVFYNFDYELERLRQLKSFIPENHSILLESPSAQEHQSRNSTSEFDDSKNGNGHTSSSRRTHPSQPTSKTTMSSSSSNIPESSSREKTHGRPYPLKKNLSITPTTSERNSTLLMEQESVSSKLFMESTDRPTKVNGTSITSLSQTGSSETESSMSRSSVGLGQIQKAGTFDLPNKSSHGHTTTTPISTLATHQPSFEVAEWNGHKHEPIPSSDSWVYLVQYVAGSEGWNCVETDAICFYSQTYSYKNFHQAHGRIDRLNTPFTDLYYYSLLSDSLIDKAIGKALKNKKNFNEKKFGHFG